MRGSSSWELTHSAVTAKPLGISILKKVFESSFLVFPRDLSLKAGSFLRRQLQTFSKVGGMQSSRGLRPSSSSGIPGPSASRGFLHTETHLLFYLPPSTSAAKAHFPLCQAFIPEQHWPERQWRRTVERFVYPKVTAGFRKQDCGQRQ